jgi:hypothetical protein
VSVRKLFELQCLEQEIEAAEKALSAARAAVGESAALRQARAELAAAASRLAALTREQKDTESAAADITARMTVANESLYSGRVKNSKELQNLQSEFDHLKVQRDLLDEKALGLMERIETAKSEHGRLSMAMTAATERWQQEQQRLSADISSLEGKLVELQGSLKQSLPSIPRESLAAYLKMKEARGWPVSRVEKGICGRCRINLSSAELQRARGGALVGCSSCGRLLFFE